MLIVAKAGHEEAVREVFAKWDLEAASSGHVSTTASSACAGAARRSARCRSRHSPDNAPVYRRPAEEPASLEEAQRLDLREVKEPSDHSQTLLSLLESPNLCSRDWIIRQYDQLVGGNTVVRAGRRRRGVRVEGTRKGLALTVDCNSRYCQLDPTWGDARRRRGRAEPRRHGRAARSPRATVLNYGNPERPDVMWSFQQGIQGIKDACVALGTPIVSGNVSFYNETDGVSIRPRPPSPWSASSTTSTTP
jgi:phosphoribosylformylglycinamidine synthase